MNGEAMMLIVFGIAVILLLSLILFFIVINPKRNARMLSQELLKKLSSTSLVDGKSLDNLANGSLDEAVNKAYSVGLNMAKMATQRGVTDGVNLATAQLLNTHPEVENRSEKNPDGDLVKDPEVDKTDEADEKSGSEEQ